MIKEIIIKKLFGRFNYEIPIKSGNINIITGPNGFGKSTVLKLISFISQNKLYEISQIPVDEIRVVFDSITFSMKKTEDKIVFCGKDFFRNLENLERNHLIFDDLDSGDFVSRGDAIDYSYLRIFEMLDFDKYSMNEHIRGLFLNESRRSMSRSELKYIYYDFFKTNMSNKDNWFSNGFREVIKSLYEIKNELGNISYIEEQRLLKERDYDVNERNRTIRQENRSISKVINEIPDKMQKIINIEVNKHSEISARLDSSFPERLLSQKNKLSEQDFNSLVKEMTKEYHQLGKYELLRENSSKNLKYLDEFSKALKIFFEDSKKKVNIFSILLRKLSLFEEIVNSKLNFKKIQISKEYGLRVINDKDSKNLELSDMSSGEQEIIVLFFRLIFESDVNLLLIDEPEISLHIAWQKELIDDFQRIITEKKGDITLIIATHSPQVIGNHLELIYDLGEHYESRL